MSGERGGVLKPHNGVPHQLFQTRSITTISARSIPRKKDKFLSSHSLSKWKAISQMLNGSGLTFANFYRC